VQKKIHSVVVIVLVVGALLMVSKWTLGGAHTQSFIGILKIVGVQSRTECRPWNVLAQYL
jgi:hypothetical protein